ncbi:MAG: hypothetical protein H7146_01840 [Burkholderiaceae bacterium]|nr:hypothetical protein [Microbacteriaceae bacterium]
MPFSHASEAAPDTAPDAVPVELLEDATSAADAQEDAPDYRVLRYGVKEFPIGKLVAEALGVAGRLDRLGSATAAGERWVRENDQASAWHREFYAHFDDIRPAYLALIYGPVRKFMAEPFYYQAVPTFRVHLPGNVAVGEFHTDGQYGHPVGELSFWMPLTKAWGSNSVWIEGDPGSDRYAPIVAKPGEIAVFNAVELRHGNQANTTGRTRVSFDFRCIPTRLLRPTEAKSINTGMRFAPGGYYSESVVGAGFALA